ncbi:MAG TPA: DUF4445 domain-containing protein [Candidatus Eisenbergiella merdipullorum]|uniref:DUF4445 domain-containing protein n=1 Tax=Candidatus Eisenbergiella merdipullorum TaxID=2838553 RepID=A0A9D2I494_9FIRM|nr:DUF4445 domain-containing protein [Candidatus Eisenbergiella merdipullorum]
MEESRGSGCGPKGYADETEVTVNGKVRRAVKGTTLGELLKKEGLAMPCAGMGRCGKCRVRAEGVLGEPDVVERKKLSPQELAGHVRLACRTVILGPSRVEWEKEAGMEIRLGENASLGKGKPLFHRLGAAVDVGTTTLAAQLYAEEGLLAQAGMENPQRAYGADVISRVERSLAGEGKELKRAVCGGIGELLHELVDRAGVPVGQIDTLVITGNTSMLYLLTGRNPESLSHAPFRADWLAGEWTEGKTLALPCPDAKVYFPPCISAFVGADITCAMLHTGLCSAVKPELLTDIGTNGEIVLNKDGKLFCCSTAAGPAFEGAGLSCGMPGEEGAIFRVECKGNGFECGVIGDGPAKGICGSGVVDAVSCLLQSGRLDETGFLEDRAVLTGGTILTGGTMPPGRVELLQEDIRKIQLAKGAINAGIRTMLHRADLPLKDLSRLLVAGGFGSSMDIKNAIAIGLLPDMARERIVICGNAALNGAADLLLDGSRRKTAEEIARKAVTVELSTDEYFKESYMEGMLFPEEGND